MNCRALIYSCFVSKLKHCDIRRLGNSEQILMHIKYSGCKTKQNKISKKVGCVKGLRSVSQSLKLADFNGKFSGCAIDFCHVYHIVQT